MRCIKPFRDRTARSMGEASSAAARSATQLFSFKENENTADPDYHNPRVFMDLQIGAPSTGISAAAHVGRGRVHAHIWLGGRVCAAVWVGPSERTRLAHAHRMK